MDGKLCYGCMEHLEPGQSVCSCGFDEGQYMAEPHQLVPGTILKERYMVGRVLGEGGFGITYVGRDTVLDLKVAVKEFYMSGYVNRNCTFSTIVRASVGSHEELFEKNKEKFLTEARVLAKFANEDGIVGIRDFYKENNTAYIVMDFLNGETLRDCLKREKKFSWQKTLEIMRPLTKSLGNVHKHNVIHRDISPDNIMITDEGKVKLLDFGAAREVSQTDIKSLSVILKPGYAPEEQYRSKGKQGPWTDIYALCATMYCCITGVVPEDSMERMFEDRLKAPCEVNPECPKAVSDVIMKGMAVRQVNRYQSIQELLVDLDAAEKNPNGANVGNVPTAGGAASQPATPVVQPATPVVQPAAPVSQTVQEPVSVNVPQTSQPAQNNVISNAPVQNSITNSAQLQNNVVASTPVQNSGIVNSQTAGNMAGNRPPQRAINVHNRAATPNQRTGTTQTGGTTQIPFAEQRAVTQYGGMNSAGRTFNTHSSDRMGTRTETKATPGGLIALLVVAKILFALAASAIGFLIIEVVAEVVGIADAGNDNREYLEAVEDSADEVDVLAETLQSCGAIIEDLTL